MSNLTTLLAHSGDGQAEKINRTYASVPEVLPVYMSSVFAFDDAQSVEDIYTGAEEGYVYSRIRHPNNDAAARVLADIDGAEAGAVFSSGMAAIVTSIISVVGAGDHIVSSPVLYGGVRTYLEKELKRFGVDVTFTDFSDVSNIEKAITPRTKLVYTESVSNPLIAVPDLAAAADIAHRHNALFFVDNTFAPVVAKPISYGADVVLYSATKYLGGHSDLVAGAAVGRADLINEISHQLIIYGSLLGAAESWLLARSLRTLELRVVKQSQNALRMAEFLEKHPAVKKVYYPGLESSSSHSTAERLFRKGIYGGMLSAEVKGGKEATAVIDSLGKGFIKYVPSLAGTSTSVSYPVQTSHRSYSREELDKEGISDGLLRFSAGIEDADDIIAQLDAALRNIS